MLESVSTRDCLDPWRMAFVHANGLVTPCCWSRPIGDLRQSTLAEILNGEEARELRKRLLLGDLPDDCRICPARATTTTANLRARVADHLATRTRDRAVVAIPRVATARGVFEELRIDENGLTLSGWMFAPNTLFEGCHVEWNGVIAGPAEIVERRDVERIYPQVIGALQSGFRAHLTRRDLAELPIDPASRFVHLAIVGMRKSDPVAQMDLLWPTSADESQAVPPAHLMERVAHMTAPELFALDGLRAITDLTRVLRRHRPPRSSERILDLGCGCGRVTRHLRTFLPGVEVSGCDVDSEAVAWCAANLDGTFTTISPAGPTPYADASFDVILAISVFTHLDVPGQRAWLAECRRILKPGGLLLASVHGPFATALSGDARARAAVQRLGISDSTVDTTLAGVLQEGSYRAVFQSVEWTAEAWGRELQIVEHLERGLSGFQDLVVLRR